MVFNHDRGERLGQNFSISLNGAKRARTAGPYNAIVVLYQLSYGPKLLFNLLDRVSGCQGFRL